MCKGIPSLLNGTCSRLVYSLWHERPSSQKWVVDTFQLAIFTNCCVDQWICDLRWHAESCADRASGRLSLWLCLVPQDEFLGAWYLLVGGQHLCYCDMSISPPCSVIQLCYQLQRPSSPPLGCLLPSQASLVSGLQPCGMPSESSSCQTGCSAHNKPVRLVVVKCTHQTYLIKHTCWIINLRHQTC